jgi:hypothetical protein
MVALYAHPKEQWIHLRTTNIVESPFASVRLRTTAAKRYKRVDNVTALIWKLLCVAEKTFRRLNAPHLLAALAAGARYPDGIRRPDEPEPCRRLMPFAHLLTEASRHRSWRVFGGTRSSPRASRHSRLYERSTNQSPGVS